MKKRRNYKTPSKAEEQYLQPEKGNLMDQNIFVPKEKTKNVGTIIGTKLLADTEVRIVEYQGTMYIPEVDVAQGLDQERNNFRHLLKRNSELLENYPLEVMVTSSGKPYKTRLLSFENTRRAIMLVDHNVADPDRREFLIERKKHYFQIIDDVCSGNAPKQELEIDFDVVGFDYKNRQFRNGIRETIFVKINRKMHPKSPNTWNKLNDMRRNDYFLHHGNYELKPKWRKLLNEKQGKSEIVHEIFSTCAIVDGKLTVKEQMAFEKELFDMVSSDLLPEYFPVQIETTKQTVLLIG